MVISLRRRTWYNLLVGVGRCNSGTKEVCSLFRAVIKRESIVIIMLQARNPISAALEVILEDPVAVPVS